MADYTNLLATIAVRAWCMHAPRVPHPSAEQAFAHSPVTREASAAPALPPIGERHYMHMYS